MIRSVLIRTPLSVTTSMFFLVSFNFSSDWSNTLCPKMYRGSSKSGQNQKLPGKNSPVCSHRAEPRLLSQAEPLWLDSGWLAADPGLLAAFWSGPEPPGQRLILSHLQMLQNSRIQPWPAYEVRGHEGDTHPDMTGYHSHTPPSCLDIQSWFQQPFPLQLARLQSPELSLQPGPEHTHVVGNDVVVNRAGSCCRTCPMKSSYDCTALWWDATVLNLPGNAPSVPVHRMRWVYWISCNTDNTVNPQTGIRTRQMSQAAHPSSL